MSVIQSSGSSMVQVQHSSDLITIPKDVFLTCAGAQGRMNDIELNTCVLIQDSIAGDASRMEWIIAQINPKQQVELELMAQVIVSKALEEPQNAKACVSLSGALKLLLPALPAREKHKKAETFMHALLDVFQTEFEFIFTDPSSPSYSEQEAHGGDGAVGKDQKRVRAIVHFAGHLYCHGLLGKGVMSQMVQDLVDNGQSEAANEFMWFIGAVPNNGTPHHGPRSPPHGPRNLGTVLEDHEDAGDSEGPSSEPLGS